MLCVNGERPLFLRFPSTRGGFRSVFVCRKLEPTKTKNNKGKLSNLFTCAKERRPSDEVCCLSHNDTRSNKVCSSSYKDNHFVFQLFWWSTLLSNSKPEMNAFTRILTQKKTTINDILKLLSKRTYLVCYYFRCHGT